MNMRQALVAAMRGDPDLISKMTDSLREQIHEEQGPMHTVVQAAEALEPILRDAVGKRPSRLNRLGFKSAHLLASLAAEDARSNRKLSKIAGNGVVGIVFVDIAGFTEFNAREGDAAARKAISEIHKHVQASLRPVKGECVKHLGDGFLLAFPSASQAVRGALGLRGAVTAKGRGNNPFGLKLRIAVHAGEPLVEQDDLLGHDVNLTARLLDHCDPDEIVVSEAAKELAERRLKKVRFAERRDAKIRGLAVRIPIYSVDPSSSV